MIFGKRKQEIKSMFAWSWECKKGSDYKGTGEKFPAK